MEEIVVANSDIEQAARLNSLRIMIVVFLSWRRYLKVDRAELICRAGGHRGSKRAGRGAHAVACEPSLKLLVSGQRQSGDAIVQENQSVVRPGPG